MSDKQGPAGFLNRWSARKQQAAEEQPSDAMRARDELAKASEEALSEQLKSEDDNSHTQLLPNNADDNIKTHQSSALEAQALEADHEQLLSDADMPPIESLSSDSDISVFFNKGVSAALKKAALRHVFMQPKYNLRDGLNDYDGDYTVFEPLGDTITSDMKWHTARKERNRLEAEARELEALEEEAKQRQAGDAVDAEENQTDEEPGEVQNQDDAQRLDGQQEPQIEENIDELEETVDEDAEALLLTDASASLLSDKTLTVKKAPSAANPSKSAQRLPSDKQSQPVKASLSDESPTPGVEPVQSSTTPDRMVSGKLRRIEKDHTPNDDPSGLSSVDRLNTIKEQEIPE